MSNKRERWNSRTAFLLAAIGSAIGLGNVWRFPYIAFKNGGGAFLIPYFFALLTAGIPTLILEMSLGQQFQAAAPTALRKAKKWFEFVGWYAILVALVIVFYYCAIMAWSLNYLIYSLTMKWAQTGNSLYSNEGEFFNNYVLHITSGPGVIGNIQWPLLIGVLVTWVAIYFCVRHGVQSVGKVVWVSVLLPFALLIIMFVRGVTLPGAGEGIRHYLTPDWSALLKPSVWAAAYGQIFFSLSVGFGVMAAYASFRPRKSDIANCSFITGLSNSGTEFFAGFAVFSVLGYMALQTGLPIESFKAAGPGLAFVTYAKAIAMLPTAQALFGVLFFLMLFSLGIDSAFSLSEAASTAISDELQLNRHKVTVLVCIIGFFGGILFTTGAGLYWLDIVDHWMNNYGLVVVAFLECLFLGWFFNLRWLQKRIDTYSEIKVNGWWIFTVKYITPVILGIILVTFLIQEFREPYEGYPFWALWIGGWGLTFFLLVLSFIMSSAAKGGKIPRSGIIAGVIALAVVLIVFFALLHQANTAVETPAEQPAAEAPAETPPEAPVEMAASEPAKSDWQPWAMGAVGCIILYGGLIRSFYFAHKRAKQRASGEYVDEEDDVEPDLTSP